MALVNKRNFLFRASAWLWKGNSLSRLATEKESIQANHLEHHHKSNWSLAIYRLSYGRSLFRLDCLEWEMIVPTRLALYQVCSILSSFKSIYPKNRVVKPNLLKLVTANSFKLRSIKLSQTGAIAVNTKAENKRWIDIWHYLQMWLGSSVSAVEWRSQFLLHSDIYSNLTPSKPLSYLYL